MPHPCFWLEPTDSVHLRIFRSTDSGCPRRDDGHHAELDLGRVPLPRDPEGKRQLAAERPVYGDVRWQMKCACGYQFSEHDNHGSTSESIYVRLDTGEETTIRAAGVGAMWDAWWMDWTQPGPDGLRLSVETPGGTWFVDGQASNCTMREDHRQEHHHCWTRHGDPRANPPTVTVDKTSGPTCAAGGGSIQCGDFHGFLENGMLT